jgi:hypothetical protein
MSDIIKSKIWEIIARNTTTAEADWLQQKGTASPMELMTAFVAAPRFLPKKIITISKDIPWDLNSEVAGIFSGKLVSGKAEQGLAVDTT